MASRFLPTTLLDRYLLKQLLDFFLLGLVVFSLIAFFSDTFLDFIQDIQRFGISISSAITMVGLQMPKIVAMVLPAATFLAVLMVFNTLNANFEVIAIRMNGISLGRLIMPALLLGVFSTILAYVLGDFVVPYCNRQTELLKLEAMQKGTLPVGQESFTFPDYDENHNLRQLIYVGKYKGRELQDSTVVDLTRKNVLQIIQSKSGYWHPDRWEFRSANAYTVSKTSDLLVFNHLQNFTVRNLIKKSDEEEKQEKLLAGDPLSISSETQNFWQLWQAIQRREEAGRKVVKKTYVNLWEKLTLPLTCMALILSAVPLALTPPRRGTNRGFVFAIGILFIYYLLRSVSVSMGLSGKLTLGGLIPLQTSLMLSAWFPILLMAGIGIVLLQRKSKVL
jgi:lipopolysaccharide export system permease protein